MSYVMTKRDRALIIALFGIICLGATIYFVYFGYNEKLSQLKSENQALQSRVDVLQSIADQQNELVNKTNSNNVASEELMNKFPALVREEDAIMYATNMQYIAPLQAINNVQIKTSEEKYVFSDIKSMTDEVVKGYIPDGNSNANIAPNPDEQAQEPQPSGDGATQDTSLPVLYSREFSINNQVDYEGFKNALRFVVENEDRCSLNVTATYDITTGILDSTITVGKYYISGTDKIYEEPEIPFIIQGTDNIFGTVPLDTRAAINIDRLNLSDSNNDNAETGDDNAVSNENTEEE